MSAGERADRPFVFVNMAVTADGKITSAAREYPRFTSAADRRRMDALRSRADAVLIGAGTLRADQPTLHVRDAALRAERVAAGRPETPTYVLVSGGGEVELAGGPFADGRGGRRIVAISEAAPADRRDALAALADVWVCGERRVDLAALLRRLREDAGVERLLVEGGGELNWGFLAGDLVDEIHLTLAPALLGGATAPTWLEGAGFRMADRRRLRLLACDREEDELFLHYAVERH
jgi:2,5-diamino-6-(ribosylamino)-4(3H)-pyrimidinone 5'-phosphate reductase